MVQESLDGIESKLRMIETLNARELLAAPEQEQHSRGYFHTLHEILQQPETWLDTCARVLAKSGEMAGLVDGIQSLALTGSGSSQYACDCVAPVLRKELGVTAEAIGAGALVTHGIAALPSGRPGLLVSVARSGDSPESGAAIALVREGEPQMRQLAITCNAAGHLATTYSDDDRVRVILLDDRVNDRSVAMTSSVTNMALAARFLGMSRSPERYRRLCERLSQACGEILKSGLEALPRVAATGFRRAVYLGSGSRFGAARESALKMLEMTAGRVSTLAETYLGVRHGPLSYVDDETIIVCFFASDPLLRAYESDLIRELNRKRLGMAKVIVGENVPTDLLRDGDTVIECRGLAEIGDENVAVLDVVVGQLLATFRCLGEGLRPDNPSEHGVINRVVTGFPMHHRAENAQP
jgi:tagatose-6-phosphate ketose/aldose isomerase